MNYELIKISLLVAIKRRGHSDETEKTEDPCHNMCGTI